MFYSNEILENAKEHFDCVHLWLQFMLTALSLLHSHVLLFLKDT